MNCDSVQLHSNGSFTSSSCKPCRPRHLDAAVLLLQPSSHAYFHFMFETLPRVQLSLQWMKDHSNASILVDAWHGNSWSVQALDLLGFGGKVVVRQAHVRYSVGIGFVPPAPPIHHTFIVELNATVQQLLIAADAAARVDADGATQSGSVLFIQRISRESQHSAIFSDQCPNGVRMREVINIDEVEAALRSRFGSRLLIFRSDGLHLAQQIKAFRNASMVIGVHGRLLLNANVTIKIPPTQYIGAGLVNTMFCREGTPVIEIIPHVGRSFFTRVASVFTSLILIPQHMLATPVTQLFHRVASAMKLRHQSYVVASKNVEPAGACSMDCMRLDAIALAKVARAALSSATDRQ